MNTTKDNKGHIKVSLTLTFKVNCQGQVIDFVFFEILDLEKVRIDTKILSVPYIQPEIRKVITVCIDDLDFEGQPSRSRDLFWFFWDPWPRKCQNRHQDQLCIIITSLVMKGQFEGSLTSNFKVIRQGHVIHFNIFEFYDLNYNEIDTKLIVLSHLHQKISRLTNIHKNSVFWPSSWAVDVMTYVTWQRQDDVTYVKMCLPSLVTDTLRRFLRLESSKKLQRKNGRGGGNHFPPPGVRGLISLQ